MFMPSYFIFLFPRNLFKESFFLVTNLVSLIAINEANKTLAISSGDYDTSEVNNNPSQLDSNSWVTITMEDFFSQ